MVKIEQIAMAALAGNSLETRSLVQDFLRQSSTLFDVPKPNVADLQLLAASASILELLASRLDQTPPFWTKSIEPVPGPIFLVKSAETMTRLRTLCINESPEPLRKRGFYAPPEYLAFA